MGYWAKPQTASSERSDLTGDTAQPDVAILPMPGFVLELKASAPQEKGHPGFSCKFRNLKAGFKKKSGQVRHVDPLLPKKPDRTASRKQINCPFTPQAQHLECPLVNEALCSQKGDRQREQAIPSGTGNGGWQCNEAGQGGRPATRGPEELVAEGVRALKGRMRTERGKAQRHSKAEAGPSTRHWWRKERGHSKGECVQKGARPRAALKQKLAPQLDTYVGHQAAPPKALLLGASC